MNRKRWRQIARSALFSTAVVFVGGHSTLAAPPHSHTNGHHHHHHHSPVVVRPSVSVSFGSSRWSSSYSYGSSYRGYSVTWSNYWQHSCRVPYYDPLWHSGYYCHTPLYGGYLYPSYSSSYVYYPFDEPLLPPIVVAKPIARLAEPAGVLREIAAKPMRLEPDDAPRDRAEDARRRSERAIFMGDKLFSHRQYHGALNQYKVAAAAAPDSALPHLRQGLALVATDRFPQAADEFRKSLDLEPRLMLRRFPMEEIYGARLEDKNNHVEALAKAALDNPANADLLFAMGVVLQLDGKLERAERFLTRAAELSVRDEIYVKHLTRPSTVPVAAERPESLGRDL